MSDAEQTPISSEAHADERDEAERTPSDRAPAGGASVVAEQQPAGDSLRFLWWLSLLGVAALVLGRFIGPALPGSGVGMTKVVATFDVAGGTLSLLFAASTIVAAGGTLFQTVHTNLPFWIRIVGMAVSTFCALVVVGSAMTNDRAPETPALMAACGAGAFAVLCAVASFRSRVARLTSIVIGFVGLRALFRGLPGLLLVHGEKWISADTLRTQARVGSTIAQLLVGGALALAIVYTSRAPKAEAHGEPNERPSFWSPVTVFALVLAVVAARQAQLGSAPDAAALNVFLKRAADRFLVQPEPYLRVQIRMFLGFLTPLVAVGLLTVRRLKTLTAAMCLAIVAVDVTDSPIGSLTLVVAALSVTLVARSGHFLWSVLVKPAR
ncbi:MAG: hypothetical protein IPK82_14295 [Polyangiaceae bacterium]|nr:hypothetical protein [Polyangiaceae bacterium]